MDTSVCAGKLNCCVEYRNVWCGVCVCACTGAHTCHLARWRLLHQTPEHAQAQPGLKVASGFSRSHVLAPGCRVLLPEQQVQGFRASACDFCHVASKMGRVIRMEKRSEQVQEAEVDTVTGLSPGARSGVCPWGESGK